MANDSITLYFREGTSDKVYSASIVAKGGGFVVNFAYGRRGSTMNTGSKTPKPLLYAKARAVYDKLVNEKRAKGYTEGEAGTPYQGLAGDKEHSGVTCQLLNPIEEAELAGYVIDPNYGMQEKFDGRRLLVDCEPSGPNGQDISGINRRGLVVALPSTIENAAAELQAWQFILDGEAVGDFLYTFDLLEADDSDLRDLPYQIRLEHLRQLVGELSASSSVRLVETARGAANKRALLNRLRKEGKEGVVIKDMRAPYTPGRPASGGTQFKFKFVKTASCLVLAINEKRSVALGLLDRNGGVVACGNVTIPSNHAVPALHELVEIQYLYAMPESHALYQPVYLGPREDIVREDCVLSQLKYKPMLPTEEN